MALQPSSPPDGTGLPPRPPSRSPSHGKSTRASASPSASPSSRGRPSLRLVGSSGPRQARQTTGPPPQPGLRATDPRWVLAVRVAEQMDGAMLAPERRQRLIRTGRAIGLSPFDANLVIAIVQDQARRGYAPDYCPTAGEPQLRMVPLRRRSDWLTELRGRRGLIVGLMLGGLLLAEFVLLRWWLGFFG